MWLWGKPLDCIPRRGGVAALAVLAMGWALCAGWMTSPCAAQSAPDYKRVLFLASYHAGDKWGEDILKGLQATLEEDSPIHFYVEHMDSRRALSPNVQKLFATYLVERYSEHPPDLVITADDAAFSLLLTLQDTPLGAIPHVFCGVNNFDPARTQGRDNITGVNEAVDIAGTIELAKALLPNADTLVAVSSERSVGKVNLEQFRKVAPAVSVGLALRELINPHRPDLPALLRQLPRSAFLLRLGNMLEAGGGDMPLLESMEMLARQSGLPVFTCWEFDFGHGALGGVVVSGEEQGKAAGGLARRILAGASPASLPVIMKSPNKPVVDYGVAKALGVDMRRVPEGVTILNQPFSIFQAYKKPILFIGFTGLLMACVILLLLRALRAKSAAEAALKNQNAFLSTLLNALPAPVFVKNQEGVYLDCNPALVEFYGVPKEQFVGRRTNEIAKDGSAQTYLHKDAELYATGGVQEYEHSLRNARGEMRSVLFRKSIYHDHTGAPLGLIGIITDITERKQAEEERRLANERLEQQVLERTQALMDANERLKELDKLKSDFVSSASHELRTPLTSILGFAKVTRKALSRLFKQLPMPKESMQQKANMALHNLSVIASEGERLSRLVNDLLDINKIEAGSMQWRQDCIAPASAITRVVASLQGELETRPEITLQLDMQPELPFILADEDRFAQVLFNLLGNALKFTQHGVIRVTASLIRKEKGEAFLHMAIADSGPGIPEAQLQRIFETFYQGDIQDVSTNNPKGAGLGLAISRQIVGAYGGRLWADSTPGQGATFYVEWPSYKNAECAPEPGLIETETPEADLA